MSIDIKQSAGYATLLAAVQHDEERSPGMHNYQEKLSWIVAQAELYAEIAGIEAADILDCWEKNRNYWYMNYYQESEQPSLEGGAVRIFDDVAAAKESIRDSGYRCPSCGGVSLNPYECKADNDCNWKSYGFFKTMGGGAYIFLKDKMLVEEIFMPVAWEETDKSAKV